MKKLFKKIVNYFKEVKKEAEKVRWPNKKDMVKYSFTTVVFILFFALFYYGLDVLFAFIKSLLG